MPELVLKLGDNVLQTFMFDKDIMSIGRSRDNDIVIENLSVSRNHARVRQQGGKYILTDLNSANGTYVNGVRVSKTEIVDDDVISLGKHKLHFVNKVPTEEEIIVDAFGADRTMIVDKTPNGLLLITEGKAKGQQYQLTKFETSIGKAVSNDIVIADDWFLSRRQVVIVRKGAEYEIQDLGGFRKTKVNGQAISEPLILKPGDVMDVGNTKFLYQLGGEYAEPHQEGRVPQEMALEDSVFSSGVSYAPEMVESVASGNGQNGAEQEEVSEESQTPDQIQLPVEIIEMPESEEQPIAPAAVIQEIVVPAEVVEISDAGQSAKEPASQAGRRKRHRQREFATERFSGVRELKDIVINTPVPGSGSQEPPSPYGVPDESPYGIPEDEFASQADAGDDLVLGGGSENAGDEHEFAGAQPQFDIPPDSRADQLASDDAPEQKSEDLEQLIQIPGSWDFRGNVEEEAAEMVSQPDEEKPVELDGSFESIAELGGEATNEENLQREIGLWEAALQNRSAVIRKQAAKRLKKLTGRDYEI